MSYDDVANGVAPPLLDHSSNELAAAVFQFRTQVSSFQQQVSKLGTPKDTREHREKIQKTGQIISNLRKEISAKLKDASKSSKVDAASQKLNKSETARIAKIARDFDALLQEFKAYESKAVKLEASCIPQAPQSERSWSSQGEELLVQQRRQDFVHLENDIDFNESIIREREEDIKDIQRDILDVHQIVQDLGTLVRGQGEMIDVVVSSVDKSRSNTQEANRHLRIAAERQKSGASLNCLLFCIFGFLVLVLVIVFLS